MKLSRGGIFTCAVCGSRCSDYFFFVIPLLSDSPGAGSKVPEWLQLLSGIFLSVTSHPLKTLRLLVPESKNLIKVDAALVVLAPSKI